MPTSSTSSWEDELRALRKELGAMRAEQQELAKAVAELHRLFRQIAVSVGIASEPYGKREETASDRDNPGFA